MIDLLKQYEKLNNSFKRKLIFHLGYDGGFFSEYNNMILAMLYCLENKIKFVLYSKDANFGYKNGWTDYFLPFCEEEYGNFHAKYNKRYPSFLKMLWPEVVIYHLFHRGTFLTFELFNAIRDRKQEKKHFYIPQLEIDGSLQEACRVLIQLTWRYNEKIQRKVDSLIDSLQLPEKYIGFHIRTGDKNIETQLFDIQKYIEKAQPYSEIKDVFILADNYLIIEDFQSQTKNRNIYTLCGKGARGYFNDVFQKQNEEFKRRAHEKLFASVDILSRAYCVIGTFSSNPGMYLGMKMSKGKMVGVDLEKWQIW
ncbi:MAG: hypothetical protein LBG15_08320 [Dysgonamonadaceae bacterium]|jgi:hypothetical protein|nr:hypothetical protein [Dysgonamonadaceae bacterium]